MIRILILVDNSRRDLLPSLLLKDKFEDNNCVVSLCNKRNFLLKIREFKPDAFLASRGDLPFLSDIAKVCKLYIIPSEGARLTPETMKSVFMGRMHNEKHYDMRGNVIYGYDFISKVYLWGDRTRKFLLSTKLFTEKQLVNSGNGRLDVYRYKKIEDEKLLPKEFTVGIAFSIKSLSPFHGSVNYLKVIHGLFNKTTALQFPMVPKGRHYEDYVWRDFAIARKMIELVLNIIEKTTYKIKFRVGPFENINDYKFLQELYPDRIIIQNPSEQLIDFLSQINVMLTCWSTTGLEAILKDIPVIAIPYLIDKEHLFSHIEPKPNGFDTFLKIYYTPESIDEAMELIKSVKNNELEIVPDIEFYRNFIQDVYNWPMEVSTTKFIVDDILNDIEENPIQNKNDVSSFEYSSRIQKLVKIMPFSDTFNVRILRLLSDFRYFVRDITSGKYISSKMHHELDNKEVRNLATRVSKYL